MIKNDIGKADLSTIIFIFAMILLLAIIIGILYYYNFMNNPSPEVYKSSGTLSMTETNSVSGESTQVTNSNNSSTNKNLNQIYEDYVKDYISSSNPDLEIVHTTTDIDNDGTPELLMKSSTCEADSMLFVFTYKNGKVLELGSIPSGHSIFYEMNNESYIQKTFGHMGYEEIFKISISNDKIEETSISSRELPANETYQKGDILLDI